MKIRALLVNALAMAFLLCAATGFLTGCSKSDTDNSVNKVLDDLSGKAQRDIKDRLVKQLDAQGAKQQERVKQEEDPEERVNTGKGQD